MDDAAYGLAALGILIPFISFAVGVVFLIMWIKLCSNVGDIKRLLTQILYELKEKQK
jgi:hypothetical protein